MKDSKEKEHRISNLKNMIDNVSTDEGNYPEEFEEDEELINYLNEDKYEDLEIDDEYIYRPDDDKPYAVNLEEDQINDEYIIKTPTEKEIKSNEETYEEEIIDDLSIDMSGFDSIIHAKVGRTPILAIVSVIIGLALIVIAATIYTSGSERIIDSVTSGETNMMTIIFLIFGLLLVIYGMYRIIGFRNPLENLSNSIDSVENDEIKAKSNKKEEPLQEKTIPKSNIPLDKDSYKVGEFKIKDLKNKFKKSTTSKKPAPPTQEELDKIPPAREKPDDKKGLTAKEIEEMEYNQVVLENESIDDIFAEVEDIDDMPIISVDGEDKKEKK